MLTCFTHKETVWFSSCLGSILSLWTAPQLTYIQTRWRYQILNRSQKKAKIRDSKDQLKETNKIMGWVEDGEWMEKTTQHQEAWWRLLENMKTQDMNLVINGKRWKEITGISSQETITEKTIRVAVFGLDLRELSKCCLRKPIRRRIESLDKITS